MAAQGEGVEARSAEAEAAPLEAEQAVVSWAVARAEAEAERATR